MNKQDKKKLIIFFSVGIFYLIFSLISIRKFLDTSIAVGHNWDSPFSSLKISYLSFLHYLPYVWVPYQSMGLASVSGLSTKLWWLFNSAFGILLNGNFVTQAKMILASVAGGLLMYYYITTILSNQRKKIIPAFISGLFFIFSPLYLGHFVGGAFNHLETSIIILLLLIVLHKNRSSKQFSKLAIIISFLLFGISISLQNLVLASLLLVLYVYIFYSTNFRQKTILIAKVFISSLFLNAYWLLPMIRGLSREPITQKLGENLSLSNIQNNVPSLSDAFFANGYIRPFYNYLVLDDLSKLWQTTAILTVGVILLTFLNVSKTTPKIKRIFSFWMSIYLSSLIFATGFNSPLKEVIIYLYTQFPPMALFRSPQWLMMPLTVSFSIILGLTIHRLSQKFNPVTINTIFFIAILFITHPFYLSGDLGSKKLYAKAIADPSWYNADHLDSYETPSDYKQAIEYLSKIDDDTRVLAIPLSGSPYYLETAYQREGAGVDPILIYAPPMPIIFTDIYTDYNGLLTLASLEKQLYETNSYDFLNNFAVFNSQYILFKKDYAPVFSHYGRRELYDSQKIEKLLRENMDYLAEEVIVDGDSTLLIKLKKEHTLPHIYIPKQHIHISGLASELTNIKLENNPPAAFYFSLAKTGDNKNAISPNILPEKNFDQYFVEAAYQNKSIANDNVLYDYQINPIKPAEYQVLIKEAFSTDWKVLETKYFDMGQQIYKYTDKSKQIININSDLIIPNTDSASEYKIDIDYYEAIDDAHFYLDQNGKRTNPALLTQTGNKIEVVFQPLPETNSVKIHISNAKYKSIEVRRLHPPQILLRSTEIQTNQPKKEQPAITFSKINPTKYKVSIDNIKNDYTLVFTETFHPDWQLYSSRNEEVSAKHYRINGYANAWDIKAPGADSSSQELIINFYPQGNFYLGLLVTTSTLLISMGYLILKRNKKT